MLFEGNLLLYPTSAGVHFLLLEDDNLAAPLQMEQPLHET